MIYVIGQDVFDALPQEAQQMIEQDGTPVSDEAQIEEIQKIAQGAPEEEGEEKFPGNTPPTVFDRAKSAFLKRESK